LNLNEKKCKFLYDEQKGQKGDAALDASHDLAETQEHPIFVESI
jgi:hypothetical protein